MSSPDKPQPSNPKRVFATMLALLAGSLILAVLWLASVLLEPYLILLAVPPYAVSEARSSAAGWANSNVWLAAQVASLLSLLVAGFVSKQLSPPRSWVAPAVLLALCVGYVLLAQFPATRSTWRISLWSIGTLVAIVLGAWMGRRRVERAA